MIRAVQPASKWKLLVVDSTSAKLLNAICKSHEILEENVTLIEDLHNKRQPFPTYEAIYLITAGERSVDRVVADFAQDKPLYLAAHLFFISTLDDALFDRIKKSGTTKYIKSIKEMNIDFIALESQVFSVDQPLAPFSLYNPMSQQAQNNDLQRMSKRILSALITLGECPYIRYYEPPSSASPGVCARLAQLVQNQLDETCKLDPSFPPPSEYKRAVLIIVDRSFDVVAPLLHEFTYQAMMSDLLIGDNSSPSYASLDENDAIWNLIKHWHFAEAVEYIRSSFTKFLSENKAATSALGGDDKPKGIESLKQMKDTLSSLPQFQEMKAKFAVHINICQECKALFEKRRLDMVAGVQQNLATGETSDGKPVKNAMFDLIPVLDNKSTTAYDKLRAFMIYIIAMEGIQDVERRRLLETAKLSTEDAQAITNMAMLGIQLSLGQSAKSKSKERERYSYWGSHKLDKKRRKNKNDDDMPYDLSRYVPIIKRVMEDQISNTIPKEVFPWVSEPTADQLGIVSEAPRMFRFTSNGLTAPDPNYPHSLRTTRASWVNRKPAKGGSGGGIGGGGGSGGGGKGDSSGAGDKEKADLRRNGPRVIVFVLGGLTYSEIRSAYEVTRDAQREVLLGTTHIYNPSQFVDILKHLHVQDPSQTPIAAAYGIRTAAVEDIAGGDKDTGGAKEKEKKGGIFAKKR
ncbi:syntaxin binding protein 1 [Polyrhizophydium stewartii]|uniref:Syntaxin binding protein 1 n=1 Tax=Polyrhizophydium stewartii TaxID=2732419 RepID=A0ABR4N8W5_9FUNG